MRGQRVGLTYPDGSALSFAYRADGALERVGQGLVVLASYQYDAAGRPTLVTRANGTSTGWSYDRAGRVTGIDTWAPSVRPSPFHKAYSMPTAYTQARLHKV